MSRIIVKFPNWKESLKNIIFRNHTAALLQTFYVAVICDTRTKCTYNIWTMVVELQFRKCFFCQQFLIWKFGRSISIHYAQQICCFVVRHYSNIFFTSFRSPLPISTFMINIFQIKFRLQFFSNRTTNSI